MLLRRFGFVMLPLLAACSRSGAPAVAPKPEERLLAPAGQTGDTLWVLLTPVRGDHHESFERQMETLWRIGQDFGARQDSVVLRTFRRTRMLRPVQPNPDGTYTYVLVTDPRISGAQYELAPLLRRMMPADSAEQFLKEFEGSLAGEQLQVLTVQVQPHH